MSQTARSGGLGLEYLSVFGMPVTQYAELAARIGCDFISVNYGGAANRLDDGGGDDRTLRESASLRRDLSSAVTANGLRIELAEGFGITPDRPAASYAADLDAVAELGARAICAVSLDKDLARTQAQFAALADMAAARNLIVTTEVGAGVLRDFGAALSAWRAVSHPSFALLIDAMHFFRKGATVQDLAAAPPEAIRHVQLCDVPMPARMESYLEEALFERRAPGDGDLPLTAFVAQLPEAVPIGLEVPIRSEANAGSSAEDRLGHCVAKARALLAEAQRGAVP